MIVLMNSMIHDHKNMQHTEQMLSAHR